MDIEEHIYVVPRAAVSSNSLLEGVGPDDADLLDRVLDKGLHLDPVDQIAVITGSVARICPFVVSEATEGILRASDVTREERENATGTGS